MRRLALRILRAERCGGAAERNLAPQPRSLFCPSAVVAWAERDIEVRLRGNPLAWWSFAPAAASLFCCSVALVGRSAPTFAPLVFLPGITGNAGKRAHSQRAVAGSTHLGPVLSPLSERAEVRSAVRGVSLAAASGEPSALAAALRRCDELRVDELDGNALAAMDSAVEEDAGEEEDHAAWAWRRAEIEGGVPGGGHVLNKAACTAHAHQLESRKRIPPARACITDCLVAVAGIVPRPRQTPRHLPNYLRPPISNNAESPPLQLVVHNGRQRLHEIQRLLLHLDAASSAGDPAALAAAVDRCRAADVRGQDVDEADARVAELEDARVTVVQTTTTT